MTDSETNPPIAEPRPATRTLWGESVTDDLAWLADREDPAVRSLLEAENAHTRAHLADTQPLQEALFDEMRARTKETDLSVPVVQDGWAYYSRTVEGLPYALHCRRWVGLDADPVEVARSGIDDPTTAGEPSDPGINDEVVILDENVEAGVDPVRGVDDESYFDLGVFDVSPDHRLLAWADDRTGAETFTLRFRDLSSGLDLDDEIEGVSYGSAWATDNATIFYVRPDDANRPFQVWRHRLGTPASADVLVFTESDERFGCGVGRDRDDRFCYIGTSSSMTDEVWFCPADQPEGEFRCVEPRSTGVEYAVAHHHGFFLIHTNAAAVNFRIMWADPEEPGREAWTELVPEREEVTLTGFDVLDSHLVLFERTGGITRMVTQRWENEDTPVLEESHEVVAQDESVHTVWPGANPRSATTLYRYGYSSMVTPPSVYVLDLTTGERTLLRQTEVLGGFDPADYVTDRTWATADDGTRIPISLVWRVDRSAEPGPCVLYAYGAYEISIDPVFSSARVSLLDRGFVFAIAHVRGGGEMGRAWYLDGKFENKVNTFTDTVACARHLIAGGWTDPGHLAIRGGSAGGLLVGAVLNQAPELFRVAVAQVPFVDALNTMLDSSLPLTAGEWEEWGNPAESQQIYQVMRGYSPYENVSRRPYPSVLATAGLADPRVGYWEPAKWVQALRRSTTSDRPVLLWTDLDAGHAGPSGRYGAWRDEARVLAFLLRELGLAAGEFDPSS